MFSWGNSVSRLILIKSLKLLTLKFPIAHIFRTIWWTRFLTGNDDRHQPKVLSVIPSPNPITLKSRSRTWNCSVKVLCLKILIAHVFPTIRQIWFISDLVIDVGPRLNSAIPSPLPTTLRPMSCMEKEGLFEVNHPLVSQSPCNQFW